MQNVVERVLNLLIFLLESSHPVTADEIRRTVQGYDEQGDAAFHRMFERDKEVLRGLGVPLERKAMDAWEVDFGYTVDPGKYAIPDPKLSDEELAALSLAARMVRLGGSHAGLDGLLKLGGVERGSGLEPLGADLGAEAGVLGRLFEAVTERKKINISYRGRTRKVAPYGVAHKRGHWYLVGAGKDGERQYRVDRIDDLEVTDEGFDRPKRFDLRRALDTQPWDLGDEEKVVATVVFDPDVAWWAARTLGESHHEGQPLRLQVPVSNRDAFIGWVLSFGASAEVVEPPELRSLIRERVEAALRGAH